MAIQTVPESDVRPINTGAVLETALLGGTAALLTIKWLRGQLDFYIHPRYTLLVVISAVLLLVMAAVRARAIFGQRNDGFGWSHYFLLARKMGCTAMPGSYPVQVVQHRSCEKTSFKSRAFRECDDSCNFFGDQVRHG